MVILRWKQGPLLTDNLIAATITSIYPAVRNIGAGAVRFVVLGAVAVLKELRLLIPGHLSLQSWLKRLRRLDECFEELDLWRGDTQLLFVVAGWRDHSNRR